MVNENIIPHDHLIKKEHRQKKQGNNALILWFTGLSGSGKSTIASKVEEKLFGLGYRTYILDGDNVRAGLNKDLGFSDEDRFENMRRVGEVAKLFVDAGVIVLAAFISPHKRERELVRSMVGKEGFIEIYINCPLDVCRNRDVKGMYHKHKEGKIKNLVGVDIKYEEPENPEIEIKSDELSIEEAADKILGVVLDRLELK